MISFAAFASLREIAVMGESPACRWGVGALPVAAADHHAKRLRSLRRELRGETLF